LKLKCIGGECDGQIQYVDDRQVFGDQVQVSKPIKFPINLDNDFQESLSAFRQGRTPDSMVIKYHMYRICAIYGTSIQGDKLTLKYLCPCNWHEWEAIQHQFGK
jgi:hypothetical protein